MTEDGRRRATIEAVTPEIDGGRFPVKGVTGDSLEVEADVFADGHDQLGVVLLHRREEERAWSETPMTPLPNDRWRAAFPLGEPGRHRYTVLAWVDPFLSWSHELEKWIAAGKDVSLELRGGADLVEAARKRASGEDAAELGRWAQRMRRWAEDPALAADPSSLAGPRGPLSEELAGLMGSAPDRRFATRYERELQVAVGRELARFSAWYEFFPRSTSPEPGRHGTFEDATRMLPYIAGMGFDIVYLPPIHPVGRTNRKGPNNRTVSEPGDPGSPWAIGGTEGGHDAVHPDLGTLEDFRSFREAAEREGLEVALDVAFQCAPDHPWVRAHPKWFRKRADGSIRHAENPPKKYEDIYPIDFESEDWEALWNGLRDVFTHWMDQGVRVFRVDNPHTKALPFWEWVIGELERKDPGVILLSEAFTRPKMMYRLAKLGFTQSYTYFAWRNTKHEITSYMEELTRAPVSEHFRPSFWPNTPDILTEFLQSGGRPAFMLRLVLAATLTASYGIYGPPFELMEHRPREPGSEEYLDSEKYQLRSWELDRADSLRPFITRVNAIRKGNPALHRNDSLRFHPVDNDRILAYSKRDPRSGNHLLMVVSLDPHHTQSGWVDFAPAELNIGPGGAYQVEDLLGGGRYSWESGRNFVRLDPQGPAHVFQVAGRTRAEEDFSYF